MRATSAGVGVPQLAPACPRIRAHAPASAAQSLRRHASPVVVRITRPRALGAAAGGGGTGQKDGRRTACLLVQKSHLLAQHSTPLSLCTALRTAPLSSAVHMLPRAHGPALWTSGAKPRKETRCSRPTPFSCPACARQRRLRPGYCAGPPAYRLRRGAVPSAHCPTGGVARLRCVLQLARPPLRRHPRLPRLASRPAPVLRTAADCWNSHQLRGGGCAPAV